MTVKTIDFIIIIVYVAALAVAATKHNLVCNTRKNINIPCAMGIQTAFVPPQIKGACKKIIKN